MKLYTEEQVNELMVLLQKSFLPEYIECDGAYCMGCWKDVVRETLKKMVNLTPIKLPSDEEIEKESSEWWGPSAFRGGAQWLIRQLQNNCKI